LIAMISASAASIPAATATFPLTTSQPRGHTDLALPRDRLRNAHIRVGPVQHAVRASAVLLPAPPSLASSAPRSTACGSGTPDASRRRNARNCRTVNPSRLSCPPARPDGFIGLAGTYDVTRYPISPCSCRRRRTRRPDLWHYGNVLTWAHDATRHGDVSVLLLHGAQDTDVRGSGTDDLDEALRLSGFRVVMEVVPRAARATIYSADLARPRILTWLRRLGGNAAPAGNGVR
jgi:hypothetical protein